MKKNKNRTLIKEVNDMGECPECEDCEGAGSGSCSCGVEKRYGGKNDALEPKCLVDGETRI